MGRAVRQVAAALPHEDLIAHLVLGVELGGLGLRFGPAGSGNLEAAAKRAKAARCGKKHR